MDSLSRRTEVYETDKSNSASRGGAPVDAIATFS